MVNETLDFKNLIDDLEIQLKTLKIEIDSNYKKWEQKFFPLYGKNFTTLRLYIAYSILFLTSITFITEYVIKKAEKDKYRIISLKMLLKLNDYLQKEYNFEINEEICYYTPFFEFINRLEPNHITSLLTVIENRIMEFECAPEFKLDLAFQGILSKEIRHVKGEFYTPPFLVRKMVDEVYIFGDKVLDPCCGSGNFIIAIIKKIINTETSIKRKSMALKNIYGFDINPFSIYLTKLSILFLCEPNFVDMKNNFIIYDFLLGDDTSVPKDFDLVLGNPPWYTLREIESIHLQNSIKKLSEELEIKPLPKNILNIEIASLFFFQAKFKFMKFDAKIFFIITEGVLNGSHAARFRAFKGFKNIKIWKFNKLIKKTFNIDFICLYAQKASNDKLLENLEIPVYMLEHYNPVKDFNYFNFTDIRIGKPEILVPYSIEKNGTKIYVKKLIEKDTIRNLIPINESYYKKLFHKGADLNPRSLIFVNCEEKSNNLVQITPDQRVFKKAKQPWNIASFKQELVEKEYIFRVVKSTELVKFFVYDYYEVFLPLKKTNLDYNYNDLKEKAKLFYDKINEFYLIHKKDTTRHISLMDNLDRWSKLINIRQLNTIKVVYNNSGSRVNSAVIQGNIIVTGDLSFYSTKNIEEAYYLSSILNSDIITNQVKIKKSSRHIFKLPFELAIARFDWKNQNHINLAELGKKGEIISVGIVKTIMNKTRKNYTKRLIEKQIKPSLKPIIEQINNLTLSVLNG